MLDSGSITLRDILLLGRTNESLRIIASWQLTETYEEQLEVVEKAIDHIAQDMTRTRQLRQGMSEDELTIQIVSGLLNMGFYATHDSQFGGHCDIAVQGAHNFLWIAEAKKHSSYDWLLKGFEQLDARYTTGLNGQNTGELLVYCYGERADKVMETWRSHLVACRRDVTTAPCPKDSAIFRSMHAHKNTGNKLHVRHKPVILHFEPTV